jgi:WD40 repeat protein
MLRVVLAIMLWASATVAANACGDRLLFLGDKTVAISHSGALIADGHMRLWDAASGKLLRQIVDGHAVTPTFVAFSPDDKHVFTGWTLLDVASGSVVRSFRESGSPTAAAFSPDGARILVGGHQRPLILWDVATGQIIRKLEVRAEGGVTPPVEAPGCGAVTSLKTPAGLARLDPDYGPVSTIAFSPDGVYAVAARRSKALRVWNVNTGTVVCCFVGHEDRIASAAFAPDGAHIVTGSVDRTVRLWEAKTGKLVWTASLPAEDTKATSEIATVAFSPDGSLILSGSRELLSRHSPGRRLHVWEAATGKLLRSFEAQDNVESVAFAPDGKTFVSDEREFMQVHARFRDLETGRQIRDFSAHWTDISAQYSPDGSRILSVGGHGVTMVWDAADGAFIRKVKTLTPERDRNGWFQGIMSAKFSRDGARVIARLKEVFEITDAASGQLVSSIKSYGERAALSADDQKLVAHTDNGRGVRVWDVGAGKLVRSFPGRKKRSESVALAPDVSQVVVGYEDKSVSFWNLQSGKLVRSLTIGDVATAIAFFPDGKRVLFGAQSGNVYVADAMGGTTVRRFDAKGDCCDGSARNVAIAADGTRALSIHWGNHTRLWNTATGELIVHLRGHYRYAEASFSPDGTIMLVATSDGLALELRDTRDGKLVKSFVCDVQLTSAAFSPNGERIVSGHADGSIRIWDVAEGRELARMRATYEGEWLTVTPEGFFHGSDGGLQLLTVVRGMSVFPVERYRDRLWRKDLVRAALAGDRRRYEEGAAGVSLAGLVEGWSRENGLGGVER